MDKIKTSTGQEKSSPKKLKLKNWEGVRIHHPEKTLMDEKLVSEGILQCLKENDTEALMEIIEGYKKRTHYVGLATGFASLSLK